MIRSLRGRYRLLAWILGASLIPPVLFSGVTFYHDITNARRYLKTTVEQGSQRINSLIQLSNDTLTDVAKDIDPADPLAAKKLQRIVYNNPLFREIGVINSDGYLVLTSLDRVVPPLRVKPEDRSNPGDRTLQIRGPMQTAIMGEESIILGLPTQGQGEVNVVVNPLVLTTSWGSTLHLELGSDGFFAYVNQATGEVLAGSGDIPAGKDIQRSDSPGRMRVQQLSDQGDVLIVGEISRAWILKEWQQQLMIGGPITALCSGLLMALSIRFAQQSEGLDHELALGLKNEELVIHYQPIIDLQTGHCVGSEALLRWYHPNQGVLSPALFIPIAEKTGLINDIGDWLIKQIAQEQAPLYRQYPELYTSINFSPSQLHSGSLDSTIEWLMDTSPCTPDRFIVEVTETPMVMSTSTNASDTLARLRSLGMRVALDDFGQGYSGLSYLHRFDIDQLKIDLYYVAAINKQPQVVEILETIIELGHKLGFTLVAEGIETAEQLQFLRDRGVHYGQGWLFSRPVPIQEFERYLTTHQSPE